MTLPRSFARATLAMALVAIAGCDTPGTAPEALLPRAPASAANVPTRALPDSTQLISYYGGSRESQRLVIRDQAAWAGFWSTMFPNLRPQPPLPAVDFTRDEVLVAALGTRGNGGFRVSFFQVADTRAERWAVVRESVAGEGCYTTQALTSPVAIVVVPRSDLPVRWLDRRETYRCE